MRRHWPFAFLIAFVLILTFRSEPPAPVAPRARTRTAPLAAPPPDVAEPGIPIQTPAPPAAVGVREADPKPEAGNPALAGLRWALRQQNDDGSWGDGATTLGDRAIGKTGVTSLVLLALLESGYSHLSREEYDGSVVGARVKKALTWLLSQQREDGSFLSGYDDRFDSALGAFALAEAHGMTASSFLREPAGRALDALTRLQGADGSWGGSTATPWAIEALISGEDSDWSWPKECRDRALAYLQAQASPAALQSLRLLKDTSDPQRQGSLAQAILSSPPGGDGTDFETLYHQTFGLLLHDRPDGVNWQKWSPSAREALVSGQNSDGSWNGGSLSHRLVRAALAESTLQLCSRFSSSMTFDH